MCSGSSAQSSPQFFALVRGDTQYSLARTLRAGGWYIIPGIFRDLSRGNDCPAYSAQIEGLLHTCTPESSTPLKTSSWPLRLQTGSSRTSEIPFRLVILHFLCAVASNHLILQAICTVESVDVQRESTPGRRNAERCDADAGRECSKISFAPIPQPRDLRNVSATWSLFDCLGVRRRSRQIRSQVSAYLSSSARC